MTSEAPQATAVENTGEVDDAGSAYEITEYKRYDPNHNMIAVQPGIFRNAADFVTTGELFTGVTVSYSHKLRDDWLIRGTTTQDSIWFEVGLTNYRKVGGSSEIYTLFPARTELRWEINLSEHFAFQFYGGVQYNFVMSRDNFDATSASQNNTYNALDGLQMNIGTGLLVHIGPQWYIRSELGFDRLNIGLGVKW